VWFLLTTHKVGDLADARRILGFYRQRWSIEQLFRTMKTKGFAVEALRQEEGPLEKLVTAIVIAAVRVLQLVAERLGGRTGYYGKPGPIVMLRGLSQFHAIKHGWNLRDV
jgi:hypothetical protein